MTKGLLSSRMVTVVHSLHGLQPQLMLTFVLIFCQIFMLMSPCSGNTHDDMLLAKFETVYTGSGDHGSSMVCYIL